MAFDDQTYEEAEDGVDWLPFPAKPEMGHFQSTLCCAVQSFASDVMTRRRRDRPYIMEPAPVALHTTHSIPIVRRTIMSDQDQSKHVPFSNEPVGSKKKEDDDEMYKGAFPAA
jgi:hypothetical protein